MIPKGDLTIPLKHPHHVHRRCWWYILVHKIIILPSLSPPLKNPPHHKSRSYQQRQKHKYKRLKALIPKTRSPLTITKATLRRRRRRRRRSSLKTATLPFNSFTIIKTKRRTRNNNVRRRDDCARKTKIKKALSRCHEILRQQRAPGDGWSDARKEKENATRAPHTHTNARQRWCLGFFWYCNVNESFIYQTGSFFGRVSQKRHNGAYVGPHQLADVGPTWQVWNGLPRFQKGVSVWTSFSSYPIRYCHVLDVLGPV